MAPVFDGVIAMQRFLRIAIVGLVVGATTLASYAKDHPVPDETSALKLAEKVLIPIYGRKQVESERPFTAKLSEKVWTVYGYLPPENVGGVAKVRIDKRNGRILSVTHTN